MIESSQLNHESPAVHKHLEIMQGVINRMAENSRSCKVWCVTLVAAILVLVARTGEPQHALIALVPALLFLFLDSYYLALERAFIASQNAFVAKLHAGELEPARFIPGGSDGHGLAFGYAVSAGFDVDLALLPAGCRNHTACLVVDNPVGCPSRRMLIMTTSRIPKVFISYVNGGDILGRVGREIADCDDVSAPSRLGSDPLADWP